MLKKPGIVFLVVLLGACTVYFTGCKGCKKEEETTTTATTDTTANNLNNVALPPRGDTTLIPILTQVLDSAFNFSAKKNYAGLASLMVYRGAEQNRAGTDVYTLKTKDDKEVVKITAEVFNKWNGSAEGREYIRIFEVPTMNGVGMVMLEVIFVGKADFNRKFFGFLKVNGNYRIAEIISSLEGYN